MSARTPVVIAISIAFALIAADGGLVLSLVHSDIKASVFISTISFALYVMARIAARYVVAPISARYRARAAHDDATGVGNSVDSPTATQP